MNPLLAQASVLGASLVLLLGLMMVWRRGTRAHIAAFTWQSIALAATTAVVGWLGDAPELHLVAIMILAVKGVAIPLVFRRMERRVGAERELEPYVNTATSLLLAGGLVLLAYVVTGPVVAVSRLPTRAALPLAVGLVFVSLFVIASRKKALTQVLGFLMLENGIALLAVLATYGVPLIVEIGVFLDALMGFLVMQIVVYRIHETFDHVDVERLNRLRR
jgi:hydrogenase-4 component E